MNMVSSLLESVEFINHRFGQTSDNAIIIGTGLSRILENGEVLHSIPYTHIPHFPISTAPSHLGKLFLVKFGARTTWVLAGRIHYYEGYGMSTITYPVRVLEALGVKRLFITNASGSLNPAYQESDLVFIEDHINLLPDNPLRGVRDAKGRSRYVNLIDAYSPALLDRMMSSAEKLKVRYHKGVYVGVQGPSLETPSEARYLRSIGADVVGMSSIPEVIMARYCGLEVGLISIVSNLVYPYGEPVDLAKILENVDRCVPSVEAILVEALL